MSGFAIHLLGPPRLELEGETFQPGRRKSLALIAYLAVQGEDVRRDALASLLWPESDSKRSRAILRQNLAALNRQHLGPYFHTTRSLVGLAQGADIWVDVREFSSALKGPMDGDPSPQALQTLSQAVALYRGSFLEGFSLPDSRTFDDWQFYQSESLRSLFLSAARSLTRGLIGHGRLDEAAEAAQRWLSQDPFSEAAHRAIMRLHAWSGRRADALRQYQHCRQGLKEELHVEPDERTQSLHRSILEDRFTDLPPQPDAPGQPPSEVAIDADAATIEGASEHHTPFVGRHRELQLIRTRLCREARPLLTVVGFGGIGKTRLATRAARLCRAEFEDGVFFVPLAEVVSEDLLVSAIADRLGMELEVHKTPEAQLLNYLQNKNLMLVLDNFEQLVDSGIPLVDAIIRKAPGVRLLVTSRERLQLSNEWLLELQALEVPPHRRDEDESSWRCSSVQLFLHCARRISNDSALLRRDPEILEICRLADGLPLALELAASWLRVMSLQEIAAQIRDNLDFLRARQLPINDRHGSLRAVFEASWEILSPEERNAFAGLSVFRGGFRRQAALRVADVSLSHLLRLIDKSLLRRDSSGRYDMHPLLAHFAAEKLSQMGERQEQTAKRHARFFATLLSQKAPDLRSEGQRLALEALSQEIGNLRASWQSALQHCDFGLAGRQLQALHHLFQLRSWFREGEEAMRTAAERLQQCADQDSDAMVVAARCEVRRAEFCILLGRLEKAEEILHLRLDFFRRRHQPADIGFTLYRLAKTASQRGAFATARQLLEEGCAIFRREGELAMEADGLVRLGRVAGEQGDQRQARLHLRRARTIFHKLGDRSGIARCCVNLGASAILKGNWTEAGDLFREALGIHRRLNDLNGQAACLNNLGLVSQERGDLRQAKKFYQQSLKLLDQLGNRDSLARGLENLGRVALELEQWGEAADYFRAALRESCEIESMPVILQALVGAARLVRKQGRWTQSAELAYYVAAQTGASQETLRQARGLLEEIGKHFPSSRLKKVRTKALELSLDSVVERAIVHLRPNASRPARQASGK